MIKLVKNVWNIYRDSVDAHLGYVINICIELWYIYS